MTEPRLHPVLTEAAEGRLPSWTEAGAARRDHMERVAELMDDWARDLDLRPRERLRWIAAARLHDVLRDAPPSGLRTLVPGAGAGIPDLLLHGPAAAERLRGEGVEDEALLRAVAFHSVGHPDLDGLGRALYLADFLEPGRPFRSDWRAELRARMPGEAAQVLREVVRARIVQLLEEELPVRSETVELWSTLVAGSPDAETEAARG